MSEPTENHEVIQPKKKLSLGDFVEQYQRLLSVLGVFAALTLFGNALPIPAIGKYLSFVTLAITMLLIIEVARKLPKDLDNDAEIPLIIFWVCLMICGLIILFNWILGFREYLDELIPILLVLPVGAIAIFIVKMAYRHLVRIRLIQDFVRDSAALLRARYWVGNKMKHFWFRFIVVLAICVFLILTVCLVSNFLSIYVIRGLDKFGGKPKNQTRLSTIPTTTNSIDTNIVTISSVLNTNPFEPAKLPVTQVARVETRNLNANKFVLKDWIAISAFVLSVCSLLISFFNYRRDRAKLVTSCRFFNRGEHGGRGVYIKAVNVGRRPIILTQIHFQYDDGSGGGDVLGHPDGQTFKENEFWEHWYENGDNTLYKPEFDATAIDFWFVDSQGKNHRVKNSKKNLKAVWEKV